MKELDLDDRDMELSQFMTMDRNEQVFAFGRIKQYEGFAEACSLGVVEEARHFGLGHKLMTALVESCQQPVYLVCIIPGFFESLGFRICQQYPDAIRDKLLYCTQSLVVPEPYVVMRKG